MAHGLEVFDSAGVKKLSITDRLTRVHSVVSVGPIHAGSGEVFHTVSGMSDDGTWAAVSDRNQIFARVASGGFYASAPQAVSPGVSGDVLALRV